MGDYTYNPHTRKLDAVRSDAEITELCFFKGVLASAPTSPAEGWHYINSGDDKLYMYYGGSWQELHALTPAALTYLLLETGDAILLENGDKLALEA